MDREREFDKLSFVKQLDLLKFSINEGMLDVQLLQYLVKRNLFKGDGDMESILSAIRFVSDIRLINELVLFWIAEGCRLDSIDFLSCIANENFLIRSGKVDVRKIEIVLIREALVRKQFVHIPQIFYRCRITEKSMLETYELNKHEFDIEDMDIEIRKRIHWAFN